MDVVAWPLEAAKKRLQALGIAYSVDSTRPYSRSFITSDVWYVLRQRQMPDGTVCLLAAAKMGKEVF
ncbi:MAG: hypothetical protein E6X17_04310 [Sporomusaceae bacterium]|nr:hypothetical protein [Sporomusaceae bacterium]